MNHHSWEDFEDIFSLSNDTPVMDNSNSLGRTLDNNIGCTLEVTIAYPRTAEFLRMNEIGQRILYSGLFDYLVIHTEHVKRSELHFETSSDGTLHCHGVIELSILVPFSIEGLVMDSARTLLFQFPKRSHHWLGKSCYSQLYNTFKSPPILIQYTPLEDKERTEVWQDYIKKYI